MAYYPFWVLLIALTILASVGGFLWAYRHRQFTDQERARYFPLRDDVALAYVSGGRPSRREVLALCCVLAIGIAAILATLAAVIMKNTGPSP